MLPFWCLVHASAQWMRGSHCGFTVVRKTDRGGPVRRSCALPAFLRSADWSSARPAMVAGPRPDANSGRAHGAGASGRLSNRGHHRCASGPLLPASLRTFYFFQLLRAVA